MMSSFSERPDETNNSNSGEFIPITHYKTDGSINEAFINLFPKSNEFIKPMIEKILIANKILMLTSNDLTSIDIPNNFVQNCYNISQIEFDEIEPETQPDDSLIVDRISYRYLEDTNFSETYAERNVSNIIRRKGWLGNHGENGIRGIIGIDLGNSAENGIRSIDGFGVKMFDDQVNDRVEFGIFESGKFKKGLLITPQHGWIFGKFDDDVLIEGEDYLQLYFEDDLTVVIKKHCSGGNCLKKIESFLKRGNKNPAIYKYEENLLITSNGEEYNGNLDHELWLFNEAVSNVDIPCIVLEKEPVYAPNNTNSILHYNATVKNFNSSIERIEKIPVEEIIGC